LTRRSRAANTRGLSLIQTDEARRATRSPTLGERLCCIPDKIYDSHEHAFEF